MKKVLASILIIFVLCTTFVQYNENLKLRREPPSVKWSKEVLLAAGNITDYPQLIKYNDDYIVAYTDGNNINIIYVDKVGKKLKEKSFSAEGDIARNIHITTDGQDISLNWIISEKDRNVMNSILLDSGFNIKNTNKVENVVDLKQAGNNLLIIGFKDSIKLVDLKAKKSTELEAPLNSLISGTKTGDKYVVVYLSNNNNFVYTLIKDGEVSECKEIGALKGTSRVTYYNSAVAIEGGIGYILAEYRYQGMYGGSKIIEFALDGSSYNVKDTADENKLMTIFNIVSFTATDEKQSGIKFMAGGYRDLGKKETYEDILELNASSGMINKSTPMSRTRALSGFPSGYEDTAVFCDVVDYDYSKLYMTSYREDFKMTNNNNRVNEYILAFIDSMQGILFTFVYLVILGALWIMPSICIASITSLFEYKLSDTKRKIAIILDYITAALIKTCIIYSTIYSGFRYFLPSYLTKFVGIGISLVISLACCIYCYKKYTSSMEKNTIAVNFSHIFILDSWLTILLFIPFIK